MTDSDKPSSYSNKESVQRATAWELLIENIKKNGEIELPIMSAYSMTPIMGAGSTVKVLYSQMGDINFGDVVVFNTATSLVGHRCMGIQDNCLITKGDNLPQFDPQKATAQMLIGKIIAVRRGTSVWNFGSDEWKSINRKIATISLLQGQLTNWCLQVESKKNRFWTPLARFLRKSFFRVYRFFLFVVVKYALSKKN